LDTRDERELDRTRCDWRHVEVEWGDIVRHFQLRGAEPDDG